MTWEKDLKESVKSWQAQGQPDEEEHPYAARMRALAESFHVLRGRRGLDPWSPVEFAQMALLTPELSGPSQLTAIFILKLWNDTFPCPRFNALEAIGRWDHKHRDAFAAWVQEPWWP